MTKSVKSTVKKIAKKAASVKMDAPAKKVVKAGALASGTLAAASMAWGAVKFITKTTLLVAAGAAAIALVPASTQKRLGKRAQRIGADAMHGVQSVMPKIGL